MPSASCLKWNQTPSQGPHSLTAINALLLKLHRSWGKFLLSWTLFPCVKQAIRQLYSDVPQTSKCHLIIKQLISFPPKSFLHPVSSTPVNKNTISPTAQVKNIWNFLPGSHVVTSVINYQNLPVCLLNWANLSTPLLTLLLFLAKPYP